MAPRGARRGPGDQEPADRDRQGEPASSPRATASSSPARRSRTTSTSCGASWRSPTRGCSSTRSAFATQYQLGGAGNEDADADALAAPAPAHRRVRLPPHEDRPGHRRRAARTASSCATTASSPASRSRSTRRPSRAMLDEVAEITEHEAAPAARASPASRSSSRSATTRRASSPTTTSELAGRSGQARPPRRAGRGDHRRGRGRRRVQPVRRLPAPHRAAPAARARPRRAGARTAGCRAPARDKIVERVLATAAAPACSRSRCEAGGTGLNLVRANHVIHFDRWWNPAVEDQASDRVWRIGQTRGVEVHTLVCPGTIEERIAAVIEAEARARGLGDRVDRDAGHRARRRRARSRSCSSTSRHATGRQS